VPIHSLLKRQLKALPEDRLHDPETAKFIDLVNRAYFEFDVDRNMLERSLDLSSQELSQSNTNLARSNLELEQFAYVASHDLQEPLRMVASYLKLLEQRYKDQLDKDAREFIEFAVDGAIRMRVLIDDLLTYSRVMTKAKKREMVDTKVVFDQAVANLQIAIEDKKATVTCTNLPVISADPVTMIQLFQNLIGNAIKFYGKEPPVVHVACEQKGAEWLFSIRDNGIGIDAANFGQIFVIFQRFHTRQEYPGTGIGLAVCKKIVEQHGGRIWPESKIGNGTTFYFTIPAKGAPDNV
jgi:light-regulated signal transduction histidine kinase (bacteriophytochrome)